MDWTSYINAVFADLSTEASIGQDDRIIAVEPEYFNALNELLGGNTFNDRTMGNELLSSRESVHGGGSSLVATLGAIRNYNHDFKIAGYKCKKPSYVKYVLLDFYSLKP